MFHLRPVGAETEDFLYRAYPKDWTVARKPKLGPPKARSFFYFLFFILVVLFHTKYQVPGIFLFHFVLFRFFYSIFVCFFLSSCSVFFFFNRFHVFRLFLLLFFSLIISSIFFMFCFRF